MYYTILYLLVSITKCKKLKIIDIFEFSGYIMIFNLQGYLLQNTVFFFEILCKRRILKTFTN